MYTASDRSFQRTIAALPPKGECRHDWQIFADLSTRMGYQCTTATPRKSGTKCAAQPQFAGATYEKIAGTGYAQWPIFAEAADDPDNHGTAELFAGGIFTTPDGKGSPRGGCVASAHRAARRALSARAVHGARGGVTTRAVR